MAWITRKAWENANLVKRDKRTVERFSLGLGADRVRAFQKKGGGPIGAAKQSASRTGAQFRQYAFHLGRIAPDAAPGAENARSAAEEEQLSTEQPACVAGAVEYSCSYAYLVFPDG